MRLSQRRVLWRSHLGGAPFGLLIHDGGLYVTLFATDALVELNPANGAVLKYDRTLPHPATLAVDATGTVTPAAGSAFGIALVGATLWTADYHSSTLLPAGGSPVQLPLPVHPFWLAPGPGGTLLVAAEGNDEDADHGAVLSFDPASASFATLARPRDPDEVLESGGIVYVAAHGDREVLAIGGGSTHTWAEGAPAVGLDADPQVNMLIVAVNAHE